MSKFSQHLKGDGILWGVVFAMMLTSLIVVYSAISKLAVGSTVGGTSISSLAFKHVIYMGFGVLTMIAVHKIDAQKFKYSSLLIFPAIAILIFTLMQGNEIGGANASRWVTIPFIGVSVQTSTFAVVIMYMYVARYLAINKDEEITFKNAFLPLWLPIIITAALILPANFSTAALFVLNVGILLIIGKYPFKQLFVMFILGVMLLGSFVTVAQKYPDLLPNRVQTWGVRIDRFVNDSGEEEQYQVQHAKVAIALGGITGRGPGKSTQKNHLPQSSSDFVFAILIEEFGMLGALWMIVLYATLLLRIVIISNKAKSIYKSLLVLSLGLPIVIQAAINMAVAVGLFPVTGQPLPLISSGGTSILMIAGSLGVILSVSRDTQEYEASNVNSEKDTEDDNSEVNLFETENIKQKLEEVV